MAYRNATYVAFAADGNSNPTETDQRYYRLMSAWAANDSIEFSYTNSHDKASACRDSSKKETIKRSLRERLNNSRNMLLFVGNTTRLDTDFVPYEIEYAVKACKIPIIVCYVDETEPITDCVPDRLRRLWPPKLKELIDSGVARTFHIPCKQAAIKAAIKQYDLNNLPGWEITWFTQQGYRNIGLL